MLGNVAIGYQIERIVVISQGCIFLGWALFQMFLWFRRARKVKPAQKIGVIPAAIHNCLVIIAGIDCRCIDHIWTPTIVICLVGAGCEVFIIASIFFFMMIWKIAHADVSRSENMFPTLQLTVLITLSCLVASAAIAFVVMTKQLWFCSIGFLAMSIFVFLCLFFVNRFLKVLADVRLSSSVHSANPKEKKKESSFERRLRRSQIGVLSIGLMLLGMAVWTALKERRTVDQVILVSDPAVFTISLVELAALFLSMAVSFLCLFNSSLPIYQDPNNRGSDSASSSGNARGKLGTPTAAAIAAASVKHHEKMDETLMRTLTMSSSRSGPMEAMKSSSKEPLLLSTSPSSGQKLL
eukprot:TRINITY_DN23608_c0_g2_i1.p1 TRINITY_DN23608_c0_g2~~TRINITY_DN23608_c0_g2_i1.p1  ORF type:complete len:352 (+),score=45.25 TRINITY_DN23608_c0_g2_i1:95-1150(+)